MVGVMEEKGSSMSDTQIFIPITALQRYMSGSTKYSMVNIQAAKEETAAVFDVGRFFGYIHEALFLPMCGSLIFSA